jgi:hypothetical protein
VAEPGTPDWWLDRLYGQLRSRQTLITEWDDWYSGDHPPPLGYEKAGPILSRLLETVGANILSLLTDAAHERMHVEGFKVGGQINDDVWDIWQGNNFDSASEQVFLEKMALSCAYALVDPNENEAGYPTLTPEHPSQCITENEPGSQRRAAGLKVWLDDLGEKPLVRAMVYLPDGVYAYAAPTRSYAPALSLKPRWEYQDSLSGGNPLGEVPLVPFVNRPRMLRPPRPEFWPAIVIQRRINKTLLDRVVMQEYGAFKQKWATGVDIPVDPTTGQPVESYNAAVTRVFVDTDAEARFGQFEAEDIRQVLSAIEADVKHAAAIVPTPPDYLLGEMTNISAEGLKAAQASLVSRVRRHMRHDEDPLEDMARLALRAAGKDEPDVASMTTVWRNPEFRTEGELVDALLKMGTLGVPREALWERWGATPQEIEAWSGQLAEQSAAAALGLSTLAGFGPQPVIDADAR